MVSFAKIHTEYAATAVEMVGVTVIAVGVRLGLIVSTVSLRSQTSQQAYRLCRERLGRSILLGIELLVASDIINTVAIEPTLRSVGVLSIIILIRIVLSLTLEVETSGHWPWQPGSPL
jgi:uncharacterized membrane protein